MVVGSGGGSGWVVLNLSIDDFHFAIGGLNTADFVLLQNNTYCAVLDVFAGGRHRAGEDHIAGPQAGGGVDIIPPLQDFIDSFAEFLGEALGLVGKLPREELVAVFGDERLNPGIAEEHTNSRLSVPCAFFDGGVGEPHRFERGELVVAGGDFFGGYARSVRHSHHHLLLLGRGQWRRRPPARAWLVAHERR